MAEKLKFKINLPGFPAGEEGVAKTIELVTRATLASSGYPQLETVLQRGIRSVGDIRFTNSDELNSLKLAKARKSASVRVLEACGLEKEDALKAMSLDYEGLEIYLDGSGPKLCLEENFLNGFNNDDPLKRLIAAINLGETLMKANFQLIVQPRELDGISRQWAKQKARERSAEILAKAADNKESDMSLEYFAGMSVVDKMLEFEGEGYRPRFFAFGSLIIGLLPGQDINTPEVIANTTFHQDSSLVLIEPIERGFLQAITDAGYTQGRRLIMPDDFRLAGLRSKSIHTNLGLGDRNELLDAYLSSMLGKMVL